MISPILKNTIADAVGAAVAEPGATFCVVTFDNKPTLFTVARTRDLQPPLAFTVRSPGYRATLTDDGTVSVINSDVTTDTTSEPS